MKSNCRAPELINSPSAHYYFTSTVYLLYLVCSLFMSGLNVEFSTPWCRILSYHTQWLSLAVKLQSSSVVDCEFYLRCISTIQSTMLSQYCWLWNGSKSRARVVRTSLGPRCLQTASVLHNWPNGVSEGGEVFISLASSNVFAFGYFYWYGFGLWSSVWRKNNLTVFFWVQISDLTLVWGALNANVW